MFHVPSKLFLWQMLKEFQVPKIVPGSKSQWSGGKHLFISFSSLLLQYIYFCSLFAANNIGKIYIKI